MIAVLTQDGSVKRNKLMAFKAHTLGLIRVAAAFAVIFALGTSLPSAAHAMAGHHGNTAVAQTGDCHAGAAMHDAVHDASQTGTHHGQDTPQSSDIGSCCLGGCIAVVELSLQPEETSLTQPVRWKQVNSQLPSREQIALLRPPRT